MYPLLRRIVEWKAGRKGAQVIIFDGGAEVEKTRAFVKGAATGGGVVILAFALTAPTTIDPSLADEIVRRERLLGESNRRAEQAIEVAAVCLNTAQNLERTLASYQDFLGGRSAAPLIPLALPREASSP